VSPHHSDVRSRRRGGRALPAEIRRLRRSRASPTFPDLGEDDRVPLSIPGRREPDGRARSGTGAPEHGQLEPVVAKHATGCVVDRELEAVDRHSLLGPTPALDADVARRDVPAPVVHDHAEGLTLTRHGHGREHDDEPGVAQPVVDPAGAEHGVLHLGDEGVLGAVEGFVPVGEGHLHQRTSRSDEMGLHADATIGIVEPVGPDHLDGVGGRGTPRSGRGPLGD
jgi:hypothetical protein